MQITNVY